MPRSNLSLVLVTGFVFGLVNCCVAQHKKAAINALVQSYQDLDLFNGSALVARKGEIILEKGFGKSDFDKGALNTPDTRFCIASLTKQFTAVLILQLQEQGKLNVHGPITRYLPWYSKDIGDSITIHHLLTHTSGLPEYTEREDFFTVISKKRFTHKTFVQQYCSDSLLFKPGTAYRYSNTNYYILGAIIEEVTGRSFKDMLQSQILDAVGMKNTGMVDGKIPGQIAAGYNFQLGVYSPAEYIDLYSTIFAAGGMYSTVRDLYLWDRALYTNQLLTDSSKKMLFKPFLDNYAYGFGVVGNFIFHQGAVNGYRSMITRVTTGQELIILLSNNFDIDINPISNGIYAILHDQEVVRPRVPIAMAVGKKIRTRGARNAIAFFKAAHAKKDSTFSFDRAQEGLNTLGYFLMNKGEMEDALMIFRLNAETFPASPNVFESYAEALARAGKQKEAVVNYQKVLQIDPANKNAKRQLNLLQLRD